MSTAVSSKVVSKENLERIDKHKTMSLTTSGERKTLKTLQLAADGTLIGSEKKPAKKMVPTKIHSNSKPVKVYVDKKLAWHNMSSQTPKIDSVVGCTQTDITGAPGVGGTVLDLHNDSGVGVTDIDQEAYDLMVKDAIPDSYWRDLAEERRLSLAEALSENEMLHQSMEEIKEENLNLSVLASQAEYLASVLNNVLDDNDDEVKEACVEPETSGEEKSEESTINTETFTDTAKDKEES